MSLIFRTVRSGPNDVPAQSGVPGLTCKLKAFSLSLASDDGADSEAEKASEDDNADDDGDGGQIWSTTSSASVAPVVVYPSASPSPLVCQENRDVQESDQQDHCPPTSAEDLNLDPIEDLNHSSSFQGSSSGIGSMYSYSALATEVAVDCGGKWRSGEKQYFNRYDRHRLMDVVEACRRSSHRRPGLTYEDKKARATDVGHIFSAARKNKVFPRNRKEIGAPSGNYASPNIFGPHGQGDSSAEEAAAKAVTQEPCTCLLEQSVPMTFGNGDDLMPVDGPYVNAHSLRV